MIRTPTRAAIAVQLLALGAAAALAAWRAPGASWDPALLVVLLVLAVASDLMRIEVRAHRVSVSASFLAIVTAAVFLGETPAALIGVATILGSWARERYRRDYLLINAVTYAWFPLLAGIGFHEIVDAGAISTTEVSFYLLVFALFVVGLLIDFAMIGLYTAWEGRSRFSTQVKKALVPILPSELASALLTVAIAVTYVRFGVDSLVMFGAVVLVFQYLVGELLVSQDRAEELELRARQLAGFQVALLSALVRTLDLRDSMTARHSAAVARYSREIAARAGLSEEDQGLVHTAGLLHDIGKFILPDTVLKGGRRKLTEEEWHEIKKHPYQGARIVSEIDGYRPVGEIILAHHERIDGRGYPRGLAGEEIPLLARIISVADSYDVMTARDTYREPVSSYEAVLELQRVSGAQLDKRLVAAFAEVLEGKPIHYKHGEDADFEAELALDKRIHEYIGISGAAAAGPGSGRVPLPA